MQQGDYVDTKAVSDWTGLSESFFNQMRVSGTGPRFYKIGRRVLYARQEVQDWLALRSRGSTSEPEQ